ncbi:hypothetical protein AOC36_04015 [Erysipelothrix larvae]|uniref:SHS2 domain-containing protein n=1 Tax=Erysipelothrix larvae TaxID=1514105 RepID=A0A120JTK8_9FIRM|nr:hypothetical protein [Erysipelothrix larvae]AMC93165.1 hypothetical protein AOC36_04015 [Erysipelothrix larvae]
MKYVIEIRDQSILVLAGKHAKKKINLATDFRIDFDTPIIEDGKLLNHYDIIKQIKEAIKAHHLVITKVRVIMNNKSILTRDLTIPKVEAKQKSTLIKNEMITLLNLNSDYVVDYRDLSDVRTKDGKQRVLACALSGETIDSIEQFFKMLKIKIDSIDASVSTMIHFIQTFELVNKNLSSLVIDINDSYVRNYLFMNGELLLFRTFFIQEDANIELVTNRIYQIIDNIKQQHEGEAKQAISEIVLLGNRNRYPIVTARYNDDPNMNVKCTNITDYVKTSTKNFMGYGNGLGGLL